MTNYDELRQAAEAVINIGIATNATEWHIIDHFQDLASAEVILALLDENEALRAVFNAARDIDREIGRPSVEDVARVLGVRDNVIARFWDCIDEATKNLGDAS